MFLASGSWFAGGLVFGLLVGIVLASVFGFTLPGLGGSNVVTSTVTETVVSTVLTPTTITVPITETTTLTKVLNNTVTIVSTKTFTSVIRETETTTTTTVHEERVTETSISPTTITVTKTTTITVGEGFLPPTMRCFYLYSFEDTIWVKVCTSVGPISTSAMRPIPLYRGKEAEILVPLVVNGSEEPSIRDLADKLWELSGGNVELFAHYALWALYQLSYNKTRTYGYNIGVQYPVYTLYSGSGVCIDYAVLYASILKAKGLDVVLILANVTGDGVVNAPHAMVGVELGSPPQLPLKYHRVFNNVKLSDSIVHDGKSYYIADPSPPPGVYVYDNGTLVPPTIVYPAFVGEDIWEKIDLIEVIPVDQ